MKGSICKETGPCFGTKGTTGIRRCTLLLNTSEYGNGTCPFQKPEREVTNGKLYPFDSFYGRK